MNEKPGIDRNNLDLHLIYLFQYYQEFGGAAVIIWFNIPRIITFLYFIKISILEQKTFKRSVHHVASTKAKKKYRQHSIIFFQMVNGD